MGDSQDVLRALAFGAIVLGVAHLDIYAAVAGMVMLLVLVMEEPRRGSLTQLTMGLLMLGAAMDFFFLAAEPGSAGWGLLCLWVAGYHLLGYGYYWWPWRKRGPAYGLNTR